MSPRGPRWLVEKVWCRSFVFLGAQACVYTCGTSGTSAIFRGKMLIFDDVSGSRKFFKKFSKKCFCQKSTEDRLLSIICSFEKNRRKIIDFRAFWNFSIFGNLEKKIGKTQNWSNSKFSKFFGLRKFFKIFFQIFCFQKSAKKHLMSITCSFEQNRRKIIDFRAIWNFSDFWKFLKKNVNYLRTMPLRKNSMKAERNEVFSPGKYIIWKLLMARIQ